MESITEKLKAMGKATYREIAAAMQIEPSHMLELLREQQDQGLVEFVDGGWVVADTGKLTKAPGVDYGWNREKVEDHPRPPLQEFQDIEQLLTAKGTMFTAEIARAFKRSSSSMLTTLRALERAGKVAKIGGGKNVGWTLMVPCEEEQPETPVKAEPVQASVTTEMVIESIPAFTESRPDDLIIPTVRGISRQIRRTRHKLAQLEKLREAIREISKHKTILRELAK